MTVSRALSAHPNVNPKTKQMVLQRAREVGYIKSHAANAMRGGSTGIVGLLLPNIVNDFYARFANELGLLCSDAGLDLLVNLTNDEPAREQNCILRLLSLQASSIILVPPPGGTPLTALAGSDTHVIELIRTRADAHSTLLVEDEHALSDAVQQLAARGCSRIAYIGADATLSSGRRRQRAYRAAMRKAGLEIDPQLVRLGDPGRTFGMASMTDLLALDAPPHGVLCGGFEISNGALESCLDRGIQFPDQLAFVGYGDPDLYRWLAGGISTINIEPEHLVRRALALVLAGKDEPTPPLAHVEAKLVLRRSA